MPGVKAGGDGQKKDTQGFFQNLITKNNKKPTERKAAVVGGPSTAGPG